jgi:hypothetical protein
MLPELASSYLTVVKDLSRLPPPILRQLRTRMSL